MLTLRREKCMKTLVLTIFIAVIGQPTVTIASSFGNQFAQMDQREKELDVETETLQIHDLEAERKLAAEEAKRQEQEEKSLQAKLEQVKQKKESVLERSKKEIAVSEGRRIRAEEQQKVYHASIKKIQNEIKKIEAQIEKASLEAKRADGLAETGRGELASAKTKRDSLVKEYKEKFASSLKAKLEARRLKAEYQKVVNQNQKIEKNLNDNKSRIPASSHRETTNRVL